MHTKHVVLALTLTLTLCLSASEVRAQKPQGSDLRVNARTVGTQWVPDVATAPDGSFVVVWNEGVWGASAPVFVMARLFDAAGRPRGGEIRVGRITPLSFGRPAVAMAPNGQFVVVWGGGVEDPFQAFGRRFDADGRPLGSRFRLAKRTGQEIPDVAMASDGSFVAVWTQAVEDGSGRDIDIFLRRFGADGRPRGPEVLAAGGGEEQSDPRVALRPDGSFVVTWQNFGGEGPFSDVRARLFSGSGAPRGDELVVNAEPYEPSSQFEPAVAVAADGRFAIAWTDVAADPEGGIKARFYTADGTALGPGRSVNSTLAGTQGMPAISALQAGGYLVIWMSGTGQDLDGYDVFGRVYRADGTPQGREIRINLKRAGLQSLPSVAIAPNGKGAAVWNGPDGDSFGIFARLVR